ncbi:PTS sugar transporter subunit IIA [bacterium]|nr:PTS sugar transporter subunit IIA [bacterium]
MTQIIVAAHGDLAQELVKTVGMIMGNQPDLEHISLEAHEGIEDLRRKIETILKPEGCLMLVDMFGGTPSNVALALSHQYPIRVLAGANLPMLIEALVHRALMDIAQLARFVEAKGKKSIFYANPAFSNCSCEKEGDE